MDRAYSLLEVKSVEDEQRIIRGLATSPSPDRLGDIVEPLGVSFKNPLPLLWQHDSKRPVGTVKFEAPTADGIEFEARLPRVEEPPSLKDRIDTAWGEIKAGLVRGVSIGFRALETSMLKDGSGMRFIKSEVLELSLVSVPAHPAAQISLIKSLDLAALAASGQERSGAKSRAGVAAIPKPTVKVKTMEISETVTRYQQELVSKTEARNALMEKASEQGRTLDAEEDEKFEGLASEIKSLSKHLERLREVEQTKAATAKPVNGSGGEGAGHKPFAVVKAAPQLEPGIRFARYAKMRALSKLDGETVSTLVKQYYPDDSELVGMFTRAAVAAATSTHATWAGTLINPLGFADFAEFLRPMTIIGKFGTGGIPSLRRIPFRVPVITQTTGGAAYWTGEGKSKPLTKFDFTRTQLDPLKVANIAVATMETIRDSSPSADTLIRDGLAQAIAERLDIDFINPAKTAVAGVSPASITNGVTPIASEGVDADAVRADLGKMIAQFTAANNPLSAGVFIMPSALASVLSLATNPLGMQEFSTVSRTGGTIVGYPVIVSDYVPAKTVVLVNTQDIYLADEGGIDVAMNDSASIEMSDAPVGDSATPTGSTSLVSMFQTNSVAFRAERTINWARRRAQSVSLLNDVDWGGTETP
jgi:HK97 family phage major capsid protein/HK97 family phage prohead protease